MVSAPVSPVDSSQVDTKSVFYTYFPLDTSQPSDTLTQPSDSSDKITEQDDNEIGFLDNNNNNNVTVNTEDDGDISNIFGDNNNETTTVTGKGVLNVDNNPFNTLLDDADTTIVNNDNSDSGDSDNSDQEEDESSDT